MLCRLPRKSHLCRDYCKSARNAYGATDCVRDPAYIKYYYPDWYTNLYGDKTPEEAVYVKNGCYDRFIKDSKYNSCYDDEDK